jgi:hypothetical protein
MKLSIETGANFQKTLTEMGSMGRDIAQAVSEGLAEAATFGANKVITDHISGQDLQRRSSNMARAIQGWKESAFDAVIGVREHSAVEAYKYLLGDEQKTIVPKNAKFLAIPIGDRAFTKSGVARYSSPRQVDGAFLFKSKAGNLIIAKKFGKTNRSIHPLFVLKKSVVVTGTGALAAGVLDSVDGMTKCITDKLDQKVK